ncbi:uncharacterized protein [Clytia hemisphaerica]|uniref:MADF domain-containing protein n=1 Tax=Clytia hemisphaerica TaxID=252671 RepID=A0A7M5WYT8_9CNID
MIQPSDEYLRGDGHEPPRPHFEINAGQNNTEINGDHNVEQVHSTRKDTDDRSPPSLVPSLPTPPPPPPPPTVPSKKKAGRPSKSSEASRDWLNEEVFTLIDIWSSFENLYNTKHKNYFNKDIRLKAMLSVENKLKERNIIANGKQIAKKLTDLKNYYGGQKRLVEDSVSNGMETGEIYVPTWKFFNALQFLKDSFTPRRTKSNRPIEPDSNITVEDDGSPYQDAKPPSAKSAKMTAATQNNELRKVMANASKALECVNSRRNVKPKPQTSSDDDADDIFGKLLIGLMKQIPECDLKEDLKINLQQVVIRCKREIVSQTQALHFNQQMPRPTRFYNPAVI